MMKRYLLSALALPVAFTAIAPTAEAAEIKTPHPQVEILNKADFQTSTDQDKLFIFKKRGHHRHHEHHEHHGHHEHHRHRRHH